MDISESVTSVRCCTEPGVPGTPGVPWSPFSPFVAKENNQKHKKPLHTLLRFKYSLGCSCTIPLTFKSTSSFLIAVSGIFSVLSAISPNPCGVDA